MATQNSVYNFNPSSKNGITSVNVQRFTSSGTYTPTSGMKFCIVEGYSGGSGSQPGYSSGGAVGSGAGNAGGYFVGLYTTAQIGASQAVTIGGGGAAGTTASPTGKVGSNTVFGSLGTAYGGVATISADTNTSYNDIGIYVKTGAAALAAASINANWLLLGGASSGLSSIGGNTSPKATGAIGAAAIYGLGAPDISTTASNAFTMPTNTGCGAGGYATTAGTGTVGSSGLIVILEFLG